MSRSDHRLEDLHPLAALAPGARGRVARVVRDLTGRSERLAALGVTCGAAVRVLQTFPGIVFECDQTELAVERGVARSILVELEEAGFPDPAGGG
jgi:Fe2+ transport system protein FeoA